nr:14643_t:CDS:2 [Entrophospora candida]
MNAKVLELANELKLLIESIYPKYDLLCKSSYHHFNGRQIRMTNILNGLLGTLKLIIKCTDCNKKIMGIKAWNQFNIDLLKDEDDLIYYLLEKTIDLLIVLSDRLEKKNEKESKKLIQESYEILTHIDVRLNRIVLCNGCKEKKIIDLAESKRKGIIKSEKYLSDSKNYKHHLNAFYTSRPLGRLIKRANLQPTSIDFDDDSSNNNIQPNTLIEYNLDSDASVYMPMHM